MKLTYNSLRVILLLFYMQAVQADLVSDSELLMNNAQKVYPSFFPSNETTQELPPWRYRFYPGANTYLGVNQEDSGVYVLGGVFGDSPLYVDKVDVVLAALNNKLSETSNASICNENALPDGFDFTYSENTVNITTNGQCVKVDKPNFCDINPEKNASGEPVATNIHVLTTTNIQESDIQGISDPRVSVIFEQQMVNSKTCLIHAPAEVTNFTINMDICLDITDTVREFDASVSGPVTNHFIGSSENTQVNDCFETDATSIVNVVTQEAWVKIGGEFVKVN